MKGFFIILLFVLFNLPNCMSQNYFNKRFGFVDDFNNDHGRTILEVDDGYIVGGDFYWEVIGTIYLGLAKYDFDGYLLWTKTIGEQTKRYYSGAPGSIIKTTKNEYLLCGMYQDNSIIMDGGVLMKLDSNFDTLWTKIIRDTITPSNYLYYFFNCIEVDTEAFVVVGIKMPYGAESRIYLVKTDHLGNIIWEHEYGTDNYMYQAYSVVQTSDGGFAIGGYRFMMQQEETVDPIIYKTDSLGNLQWQKNIGGAFADFHPVLTISDDNYIIVGNTICDSMLSPSVPYRIISITKMDNEGNIIWSKKHGISETENSMFQIRTIPNLGFIATGMVVNDFPHISGWVFKANIEGDSVWYRKYDHLYGEESGNYLWDIIPTSDNGYICSGYVDPYPPDVGSQDAWILKLDSLGCDTPGCDPMVGVIKHEPQKHEGMMVYPNPARDFVEFKVESYEFKVGGQISVYGVLGDEVARLEVKDGRAVWDCRNMPRGICFWEYKCEGILLTGKIILNDE